MSHNPVEPLPSQRAPVEVAGVRAALVDSANDAIIGFDRAGAVVVWNAGSEALFGWTAEEMLGRSAELLVPAERRAELTRLLTAMAGTPEPAALETERLHKSGAVLPVSCRVSPVRDAAGEVIGACAVLRDNSRETELRRQLENARHLAEARFQQSVVPQASLTPEGVVLEVNPALCRLTGHAGTALRGRLLPQLFAEPGLEALTLGLAALASGEVAESRHPQLLRTAQGDVLETRVSLFPLRDDVSGEIVRLEAVVEDVSAAAAAGRELQLSEARWQSLAAHSADVGLFCDADARLLFISPSVTSVFGYRPEDLLEADGWSFVHPDDVAGTRALWASTAAAPLGTSETFELRLRHADGSWHWVEESLTNRLADPAIAGMVVNLVDISERKAAEAVLEELAGRDTLTGLATRAPLMAALDVAFAAGRAASTALALVDLTRFKLVNDTHGNRTGDEVLAEVADRLQTEAGGRGVVARVGGDRFAVMLHDLDDVSDVFEAVGELLVAVEAPLQVGEQAVTVTATIGAALGPAVDSGALLASAEAALQKAKEGLIGPMHVVRAESMSAGVASARLVEDLRGGLQRDELVVHFQPVMSLADGQPVAAEALVRWLHPEKGLLSPGAFIGAAEDSGLILGVGEKVLREACRAAARWAQVGRGARPFHVAVNLSARQLTHGAVVDVVRAALAESGAAPGNLMLEVTESAVMADVDAAVLALQELRELGVAIAVDDFGTGYSSLTYLKQFPVTALKIDRSFVGGLGSSADDAAIVTSVINLARSMQLDCIAEGVETEQQRLVLQALGCPYGQGFLWAPGLDVESFETWLASAAPGPADTGGAAPARASQAMRRDRRVLTAERRMVRPVPADALVLARIHELTATGASPATIAAALNAEQQRTPLGKRWSARSVAELLAARPH